MSQSCQNSKLYDPWTIRHLEATGLDTGWQCWEVGGGGGSIAAWLAERCGSEGHALVTDIDPRFLAQSAALDRHNVEIGVRVVLEQKLSLRRYARVKKGREGTIDQGILLERSFLQDGEAIHTKRSGTRTGGTSHHSSHYHRKKTAITACPVSFSSDFSFLCTTEGLTAVSVPLLLAPQTLAFGFAGAGILTFSYGFLENVGFPHLSWMFVWPLMIALWGLGGALARRRYS